MATATAKKISPTGEWADEYGTVPARDDCRGVGMEASIPHFYGSVSALNRKNHGELKLRPMEDYSFAKETTSIVLTASEIPQAASSYPIVFGRMGPSMMAFAVTGHANGNNVFIGGNNRWREGYYIPAYVRRYPFMLIRIPDKSGFWLAADETSSLCDCEEGTALYENGVPSETTRRALAFCVNFSKEMDRTRELMQQLDDCGILVERSAEVSLDNRQTTRIAGFNVVDERRLAELDDEIFLQLRKTGMLKLISCHLWSVRGWKNLVAGNKF